MDQSVALMAQMEKSGANSETVMQGLRKALKNAAADGIPLDQALSDLQNTILNGTDGMDGLTAAYDLFGKSGDQIYGAVKNGTIDFSDLNKAAEDTAGTLDSVFNETLTPADKFQTTLNTAKDAGYELGSTLLTMLMPALEKVSGTVQKFSDWWTSLSPKTQKMITVVGLIVAAIGPLLVVLGSLASALSAIIAIAPMVGAAFTAMLGPIGLIIAGIAAAIAIGILLVKNWDKIKAATVRVWSAIKNAITKPIKAAADFIKKIIEKIKSFFQFKVSLPKIKLPHFGIKPKGWKLGDLLEGVIPSLGIDWYAKGGIFSSPRVIGVGEAGPEAVVPIDKLQGMIAASNSQLIAAMITAMQAINAGGDDKEITIQVNLGGAQVATEIFKLSKQGRLILEA